jgi:hypothetical protein
VTEPVDTELGLRTGIALTRGLIRLIVPNTAYRHRPIVRERCGANGVEWTILRLLR